MFYCSKYDLTGILTTPPVTNRGYSLSPTEFWRCYRSLSSVVSSTYTDGTTVFTRTFVKVVAPAIHVLWESIDGYPGASMETSTLVDTAVDDTKTNSVGSGSTTPRTPGSPILPPPLATSGAITAHGPQDHTAVIAISTTVPVVIIALIIIALISFRRRARRNIAANPVTVPELDSGERVLAMTGRQFWPASIELATHPAQGVKIIQTGGAVEHAVGPVDRSLATTPPLVSGFHAQAATSPPVSMVASDQELHRLHREREIVNVRRERLLKLEALDDEDRELQRQIDEHMGARRSEM